jgi:hypothetical protein
MLINGLKLINNEDNCYLCIVENLTPEIKLFIKNELLAICRGEQNVAGLEDLDYFSYERTIKDFLKRYNAYSKSTKKGMIGEFLAHLLTKKVLPNLSVATAFFNTEEISIRKGFDVIYYDEVKNCIWYGEVKSGEKGAVVSIEKKNKKLIYSAKKGMQDFLSGERENLWTNVVAHVNNTVKQEHQLTVKRILNDDLTGVRKANEPHNVILFSVLFHTVDEPLTHKSISDYLPNINSAEEFNDVILFSIQKSTFNKIKIFLEKELEKI